MDKESIGRQLNRPQPPADLLATVQGNWQLQQRNSHKPWNVLRWGAVAGVVLVSLLLRALLDHGSLVSAAMEDIAAADRHAQGVSVSMDEVASALSIALPLPEMTLLMSKRCHIEGLDTVHLQIAGARRGEVHLFIHQGAANAFAEQDSGKAADFTWRMLSPREDLSVLVLYSADMKAESVEALLQHMFYS